MIRFRSIIQKLFLSSAIGLSQFAFGASPAQCAPSSPSALNIDTNDLQQIDDLEKRTFQWFWDSADPETGLIPDRYPSPQTFASVASSGFGLTAYGIGVSRHYITREQAVTRTLASLHFLLSMPQNDSPTQAAGYHGFFYHFLNPETGFRLNTDIELSSIDTALLMQGVLFAYSFYDQNTPEEQEIRTLADTLYQRVDWQWMKRPDNRLSMGWSPEHKFITNYWEGYSEGMMIYILAIGSPVPAYALTPASWTAWLATNDQRWGTYYGQTFLNFAPLFGHQYTHAWIDFRGIQDSWIKSKDIDYFENSRRAAYSQQAYAKANPGKWIGYSDSIWGLTASDGPGDVTQKVDGRELHFSSYAARGTGRDFTQDDGTIAPTAALGSIAFAPEIVIPSLRKLRSQYGNEIYGKYGFVDAFNPTFKTGKTFWSDKEYLGIDQGPILLMIENWRTGLVWNIMKKNPYIQKGLRDAGFHGGWLETSPAPEAR